MAIQTVILAAGQGKRMYSELPKVLHHLAGKPLLEHVICTSLTISPDLPPIIVHGHQGHQLQEALAYYSVKWVEQKEQLGTGHALMQALPMLNDQDQVLVLYGDVPLITAKTLKKLISATPADSIGMLIAELPNPTGYGRIKRDYAHRIVGIVEEKDANDEERAITEINPGIYLVPAKLLKKWLPTLKNQNAQGEYYLTDIVALAGKEKVDIHAVLPEKVQEIFGVNDRVQLAQLERFYQQEAALTFMRQGVTLIDPARFDIRGTAKIGRDVVIDVNVILEGEVVIGDGCYIGPNTFLRNTTLAKQVEIKANSMLDGAKVASYSLIGPFARLRPGTVLHEKTHIGNFVEVKNSEVGTKTKINHLTYIGDSSIGKEVNVGAGTITCNYDGVNKHKTVIGDRVQVGSDTTLVAPVTIHDDVYIATATTIRKDVPAGALVFNTREEKIREGWTAAKKAKQKQNV